MTLTAAGPPSTAPEHPGRELASPHVTAVLVAHDGGRWLPRTLAALSAQTRPVDHVVAVDTGSLDTSPDLLRDALGADHVLQAPRRTGFGDAVRLGLNQVAGAGGEAWVWLLHDDTAPAPTALQHLLDVGTGSPQVGVVGPKVVDWDDGSRLLEAGLSVSRGGRRDTGLDGPERDQGQHDHRSDVLAVGSGGLLVRREVWDQLGGFDPALPLLRDDIDLCWRAQLAGRRVVLATRAVVAEAQAGTRGLRHVDAVSGPVRRVDRRHGLQVALARCALPALPVVLAWLVLTGLARSLALLAAKAPGRALDELMATVGVVVTPWRWAGSRRRTRGTRRVHRRDVSALLTPRLAALRRGAEVLGGFAAREAAPEEVPALAGETGPTADEAEPVVVAGARWPRRLLAHPLTLVLVALTACTALASRRLLGAGVLGGGQLLPAVGRPGDLWQAAADSWRGAGLGTGGAPSPGAFVRAGATALLAPVAGDGAASRCVDLLLLGAPMLAAVAAYLALRPFVRSRWARAWAAAVWATTPVLTAAVAGGRPGPVAACLLTPLVVLAFARALAPRRSGSTTAAFAGALGLALLGSAVPALLVPGAVAAAVGVLLSRGAGRVRALVLLVVPPALLGPWLATLVGEPRLLLGGPGALDEAGAPAGLTPALAGLAGLTRLAADLPAWAPAVLVAPVLLAGLTGLLRAGGRGRAVLGLWVLGLGGLSAALVAPSLVVARTGAGELHPYVGTGLMLLVLAAVAGAAVGADGLRDRLAVHGFGWRQLLVGPLVLLAVLGPVAGAGLWAWRGSDGPLVRIPSAALPAVALDGAQGPAGTRTLVLAAGASGSIGYLLEGAEPGPLARDLPAESPGRALDPVRQVVALLATPLGASGPTGALDPVGRLGRLAVGFVLVRGPVPQRLVERLDSTAGLARIGSPPGAALWRVGGVGVGTSGQQRSARVRVETADGAVLATVAVAGPHAAVDTRLGRGAAGRRLVLSEPVSAGWHATLDGRALTPLPRSGDDWRQAFALPTTGGHLLVQHLDPVTRWWHRGQLVLVALVLLLALPVRRPRDAR